MPTQTVKRRPLTDDEKAIVDVMIERRLNPKGTPGVNAKGGEYHETVCVIEVIDDPPGTTFCPPCPTSTT